MLGWWILAALIVGGILGFLAGRIVQISEGSR